MPVRVRPPLPVGYRPMAGPLTVNQLIGVRVPVPELWLCGGDGVPGAPSRRRSRVQVPSRPPCAHRLKDKAPDYGSGNRGSTPRGRTHGRLAQRESDCPTSRGFGVRVPGWLPWWPSSRSEEPGREPGWRGCGTLRSPHGRLLKRPTRAGCKPAGTACAGSTPAPATEPPVTDFPLSLRRTGAWFDSRRGRRGAHLAGAGCGLQNRRC